MRVVERPAKVVRIRIDEMEEGKNLPGCETIHLTDTTSNEVYLQIVKALGIQDQILQMKKSGMTFGPIVGEAQRKPT